MYNLTSVDYTKLYSIPSDLSVNIMYVSVVPYCGSNGMLSIWVSWILYYWRDLANISKGSKPINTHFEPSNYLLKFASDPLL